MEYEKPAVESREQVEGALDWLPWPGHDRGSGGGGQGGMS